MDAPFESLPLNVQKRITSLRETVARVSSIDGVMVSADLLEKFYNGLAKIAPFLVEKQDKDAEEWVIRQLTRGDDWVADMADALYSEGLETRRSALETHLCSGFGKSLPSDFSFSADEEAAARDRAETSAQDVANTFNKKIPTWIEKAKVEWIKEHGDLGGLDRYKLLKLTKKFVVDYEDWHTEQVATTEFANEWGSEVGMFWMLNAGEAELEYHLAPDSASDPERDTIPICMEYCNKWLDESDATMFPAHVSCIHFIDQTRVKEGTLPLFVMVGASGYSQDQLPEC